MRPGGMGVERLRLQVGQQAEEVVQLRRDGGARHRPAALAEGGAAEDSCGAVQIAQLVGLIHHQAEPVDAQQRAGPAAGGVRPLGVGANNLCRCQHKVKAG